MREKEEGREKERGRERDGDGAREREREERAISDPVILSGVAGLGSAYSLPLAAEALGCEVGVGVGAGQLDAIGLGNPLDLAVDAYGSHALFVGLGEGELELVMCSDQNLGGGGRGRGGSQKIVGKWVGKKNTN